MRRGYHAGERALVRGDGRGFHLGGGADNFIDSGGYEFAGGAGVRASRWSSVVGRAFSPPRRGERRENSSRRSLVTGRSGAGSCTPLIAIDQGPTTNDRRLPPNDRRLTTGDCL